MLKTRISQLQWWLLIALLSAVFVGYPHLPDGSWWWSVLFITAFYLALFAVLRLDIETKQQASERKQVQRFWSDMRSMKTTIALPYPPTNQLANPGSLWYVQQGDAEPTAVFEQRGTRKRPDWRPFGEPSKRR